jgi:negative regulator of sigma E activity
VSVFVEQSSSDSGAAAPDSQTQPPMQGLARVGSGYAFSTVVQGHQVTAVGEVPAQTVEFIAHSVKIYSGGEIPRH